jgi:hypothetical protein
MSPVDVHLGRGSASRWRGRPTAGLAAGAVSTAATPAFLHEVVGGRFQEALIVKAEGIAGVAIDIQHPEDALPIQEWHDDLRAHGRAARDVARIRSNIGEDDGFTLTCSQPAHPGTHRNACRAGGGTLVWPEYHFFELLPEQVKADPGIMRSVGFQNRGDVRQDGGAIVFVVRIDMDIAEHLVECPSL